MTSLPTFKSLKVLDYEYTYLDSGAPASTNYTTWIILHGMGFNAVVFEKLLPLAHAYNLRIVSVNRRGYPPSSGFRDDELTGVGFGKKFEDAEPFFRAQGTEVATFIVNFATEQGIPLAHPKGRTGGVVLIGWSLASIHLVTFLAYVGELSETVRSELQKYLHTIFTHDPLTIAFGIPPPDRFNLSASTEIDGRKRFDTFFDNVTGHFIHKSVVSGNIDDLEFNLPSDIPHSMRELSYEQRAKYTHPKAFADCDGKLAFCDPSAFAVLAKRALFDKVRAKAFPNVQVRYMSSGESSGLLVWAAWMLQKYLENPESLYGSDAEKARDIKCINQVEGNHFIFWEDPKMAIEQYIASINL